MMIPQGYPRPVSLMLAAALLYGFVCSLLACGETSPAAREPSHQAGEPSRQVGESSAAVAALPAASSSPNPFRDSLVTLLPETSRAAGQRDADLEADEQRCRELAAASVAAQGEWDLVEVRVDEQERVFFYYQRQVREGQVASSGGHFACRVDDGELLLLLEG